MPTKILFLPPAINIWSCLEETCKTLLDSGKKASSNTVLTSFELVLNLLVNTNRFGLGGCMIKGENGSIRSPHKENNKDGPKVLHVESVILKNTEHDHLFLPWFA